MPRFGTINNSGGGGTGTQGPAGTPSSKWYSGIGAPSGTLGVNTDCYLDKSNYDVYQKSSGVWSLTGNIKGAVGATGPTGATGPQGPKGDPGPIGPAGLTWQGQWSDTTAYVKNDCVGYSGASYFCLSENTNVKPVGDAASSTNWALLASQGAPGVQGPIGPAGVNGAAGLGVQSATVNASGHLILTLTDNSIIDAGITKGDTGPQGIQGMQGPAGPVLNSPLPRQTVVSASVDVSGQPNYLQASGLNVNLLATGKPVILSFADGFDANGNAQNDMSVINADVPVAWALSANETAYLYIRRNGASLEYGKSALPCVYSKVEPIDPLALILMHFNGNLKEEVSQYIYTPSGAGVISYPNGEFGQGVQHGSTSYTTIPIKTAFINGDFTITFSWEDKGTAQGGAIISVQKSSIPFLLIYVNTANGTVELFLSSNGSSWQITSFVLGNIAGGRHTFTATKLGTNLYGFRDGTLTSSLTGVTMSVPLTDANLNLNWWTNGSTNYYGTGVLDELFITKKSLHTSSYTVPTSEYSLSPVSGQPWFDLNEYKQKYFDGTVWQYDQRLYVGEAVANASSITTLTPYALQGRYEATFDTTASVTQSRNHNIGCPVAATIYEAGVQKAKDVTSDRTSLSFTGSGNKTTVYAKRCFD